VTDWPTVPYVAQGFVGSRPAGATVAAWAVMHFLGEDGYLDYTRRTFAAKDRLTAGLRAIDGVRVWDTDLCILCYETEGMSPFDVVGGMQALGWVHFGTLEPPLVQLVLDPLPDEVVERYLADVRRVVADVRAGRGAGRGAVHYAEVKP
jgi:sphinganine-1-phosphate aldolase